MVAINDLTPLDFDFKESDFEVAIMAALAAQMIKYDSNVSLEENVYSFAPLLLKDAILASGCAITEGCEVPEVLTNSIIQMAQACQICLTNLSAAERKMYGIDLADPQPTQTLSARKAKEQAMALVFSMLKTYWIGNKEFTADDLKNADLLPAYQKDNGQWTKIAGIVGVPHYAIARNAQLTTALQLALTFEEALAILDGMMATQSIQLQMIPDDNKFMWVTNEIYDVLRTEYSHNALSGLTLQPIESQFGTVDTLIYRGVQVIKYQHFSAAIRDIDTGGDSISYPHRAILTATLPQLSFPKPTEDTFSEQFYNARKSWEAGTIATILHPDPVQADWYVVGY